MKCTLILNEVHITNKYNVMNEETFTELIKRYQTNNATVEEKALLEQWLIKRGDRNIFSVFTAHEKGVIKGDMLRKILDEISGEKKTVHRLYTGAWLFRAAAAIL